MKDDAIGNNEMLDRAIDFMNVCHVPWIGTGPVLAVSRMSPVYFWDSFKARFGITPVQYQAWARVQKGLSIQGSDVDVSKALGYRFTRQYVKDVAVFRDIKITDASRLPLPPKALYQYQTDRMLLPSETKRIAVEIVRQRRRINKKEKIVKRLAWMKVVKSRLVYFIAAGDNGPVKIGSSVNPQKRLQALQGASSVKLSILLTIPGGYDLERRLHVRFATERLTGEWFERSKRLVKFIDDHQGIPFDF